MALNIRKWLIALIFIFAIVFAANVFVAAPAYAFSSIELTNITYTAANGEINTYPTDGTILYAKNVKLHYQIASPQYVVQEFANSSGEFLRGTSIINTDSGGTAEYTVVGSGEIRVVIQGYNDGQPWTEPLHTVVYSDNTPPDTAVLNDMTEWQMHSAGFIVSGSVTGSDLHSGISKVLIVAEYDDGDMVTTELNEATGLFHSFTIYEQCEVTAVVYDNAGNYSSVKKSYDKFDSTPPTAPTINAVPNVDFETGSGYAREYTVTLSYGTDGQSGVMEASMAYILNGEVKSYNGGFLLDKGMAYEIKAYYSDKAGNLSPAATLRITNIDRIDPYIEQAVLTIDIRNEKPFTIRLKSGDGLSGLKSIRIEGINAQFTAEPYNFYTMELATLDVGTLRITSTDKVGNFTTAVIPVYHFDNVFFEERIMNLNATILDLNEADYNETAWEALNQALVNLNIMLMSGSTSTWEFNTALTEIDKLIAGSLNKTYVIMEAPDGISLNIKYSMDETQLAQRKKGDTFSLAIDKLAQDEIGAKKEKAKNLSGFSKGEACPFVLGFMLNGNPFTQTLESGVDLSMAVPQEHRLRYVKVIDLETEEVIPSEVINNYIQFNVKKPGKYAIVYDEGLVSVKQPKLIKVFGKNISLAAFLGSLGGAVGAMAISIIILTTVRKKRK